MKVKILSVLAGAAMLAGIANAEYKGLWTEEYTNAAYEAPPNTITFRLYATFDNDLDQLTGMGGSAAEPWELYTTTAFYNDETAGSHWAHNAFFDDFIDFLHYDSYWTIGTDDSEAGAPLGIAFPGEQPIWDATHWFANDGGVFRTPEDPLSFGVWDPDLELYTVLIGNFTMDLLPGAAGEYAYGAVKMNMVSDGAQLNIYEDILVPIPAPGALALLGLAGLVSRRRR
ncbi:MAG: hypothetical protein JSV91_07610 [Phycisphaerales bacterium]|nr:MAG: hypothetical protein JSV91_07610 [Phycisphaerales bacterium]